MSFLIRITSGFVIAPNLIFPRPVYRGIHCSPGSFTSGSNLLLSTIALCPDPLNSTPLLLAQEAQDASLPIGSRPSAASVSCSSRLGAKMTGSGSKSPWVIYLPLPIREPTGASRPSPIRVLQVAPFTTQEDVDLAVPHPSTP